MEDSFQSQMRVAPSNTRIKPAVKVEHSSDPYFLSADTSVKLCQDMTSSEYPYENFKKLNNTTTVADIVKHEHVEAKIETPFFGVENVKTENLFHMDIQHSDVNIKMEDAGNSSQNVAVPPPTNFNVKSEDLTEEHSFETNSQCLAMDSKVDVKQEAGLISEMNLQCTDIEVKTEESFKVETSSLPSHLDGISSRDDQDCETSCDETILPSGPGGSSEMASLESGQEGSNTNCDDHYTTVKDEFVIEIDVDEPPENDGGRFQDSSNHGKEMDDNMSETYWPQQSSLVSGINPHENSRKKPFLCTTCGRSCISNSKLKKHIRTHTGETPYHCTTCGKSFSQNSDLKIHIKVHSGGKPYHCTACGESFSNDSNLKTHIRTHFGEKPYLCTICGRSCVSNSKLKKHIRTHTGEKPYLCTTCGKSFTDGSMLKIHIRTHTGEKPYDCTSCGKSFTQTSHLKGHACIYHRGDTPQPAHLVENNSE